MSVVNKDAEGGSGVIHLFGFCVRLRAPEAKRLKDYKSHIFVSQMCDVHFL